MNDNNSSQQSDLEIEFINEQKGEGSLSIHVASASESSYIGFDINPEDVEALFFEGIGIARWESIVADNVEEQTAKYWESFNDKVNNYPLLGRIRDTDERIKFTADEARELAAECEKLSAATTDTKALRALQKLALAAQKAVAANGGLDLKPSQAPEM